MEALKKIKDLVEKMSVDTKKVVEKRNHSASIRARQIAQELKLLIPEFRKEILEQIKANPKPKRPRKLNHNNLNLLKKK